MTRAGWYYPQPSPGYELLFDRVAIYPGLMDECRLGGEIVQPQAGDFYGGWVTSRVTGPFKGEPGTFGWSQLTPRWVGWWSTAHLHVTLAPCVPSPKSPS